jgi:hypothetical protein
MITQGAVRKRPAPLEEPQGRSTGPALLLPSWVAPTSHCMSATVKKPEQATDGTR